MCNWLPSLHHISVGVAVSSAVSTVVVSWLAYFMGRSYFNKGQRNTIDIEHYKRALDSLNAMKAGLSEHERLIGMMFDDKTPETSYDALLQEIANNHNGLDEKTKVGLYVPGVASVRSLYLAWYTTWFVDSEEEYDLMNLADPIRRTKLKNKIFQPINAALKEITIEIEKVRKSQEPQTSV